MEATPNDGGVIDHPSEELKGFKAAFDELDKIAKSAAGDDGPIGELSWARSHLSSLKLASGAFGPSHEANGAVRGWNDSLDQRHKELTTCINNIADMADKLQKVVDEYVENEEKNEAASEEAKKGAGDSLNDMPRDGYHDEPGLLRPGAGTR